MDIQKIVTMSLTSSLLIFAIVLCSKESLASQTQGTTKQRIGQHMMLSFITRSSNLPIPTPDEDAIITKSIKKHIENSKILSRFNIDVKTEKGIVTLKGNVNSNSQAMRLIELAQSIIGVRDVRSQLTVERSRQVLRDTVIAAKVKGLFIREGIFGSKRGVAFMDVEARNGIVYLRGDINNKAKIDRAIHLIRGMNGVKGVEYKFTKFIPDENHANH